MTFWQMVVFSATLLYLVTETTGSGRSVPGGEGAFVHGQLELIGINDGTDKGKLEQLS